MTVSSQEIQSHNAQQNSGERFIGREENSRMAGSSQVRNSSKLNRIQGLYTVSKKGVQFFKVELSRVFIGGISCTEIGLSTL